MCYNVRNMATLKQKALAKNLLENKGKSVSNAMLEVGYPPATARNPQQVTKSKGWQELMEQYLPDEKLAKVHEEGLEATKWNDFTGDREKDYSVRKQYLELGYKVKGKMSDRPNVQVNVLNNIQGDKDKYEI